MSTDRDLLELAAKAAGIAYDPDDKSEFGLWLVHDTEPSEHTQRRWNPLKKDGDALRLAVMLDIGVFSDSLGAYCNFSQVKQICVYFSEIPDIFAATRRAIVRAAAEIGKSMS